MLHHALAARPRTMVAQAAKSSRARMNPMNPPQPRIIVTLDSWYSGVYSGEGFTISGIFVRNVLVS